MRVHLSHLGCKLNQAEVEQMARRFLAAGYEVVASLEQADLHVVNTCTVTHAAARDSRKVIRRGGRRHPGLRTVVTGCWSAEQPGHARALPGVDLVVPNHEKEQLVERVREALGGPPPPEAEAPFVPLEVGHTRTLVKIEDGCAMRCAFCIIPSTRGPQQSRPEEEIATEVAALERAGFGEIVLTGVQISAYRWAGRRLADLVEALLAATSEVRFRLTSIAPWQLDRRLLDAFGGGRLCRHLHFSLQSGSTGVLRRMRRPYTAESYRSVVDEVRDRVSGVAVTTDVVVGFPGETDREHQESLELVERLGFAKIHVFPFSARPGTEAAGMADPVDHETKRRRMDEMLEVAARSESAFAHAQLGRSLEVLWEGERRGVWRGTTDNYLKVRSSLPPAARRETVRIGRIDRAVGWVAESDARAVS